MLDERIQVVMKRATATTDANKILSAQLHSIQIERDAMRALVGVERNRANDQTAVAAAARASAATAQSSPTVKSLKGVSLSSSSSMKKVETSMEESLGIADDSSLYKDADSDK